MVNKHSFLNLHSVETSVASEDTMAQKAWAKLSRPILATGAIISKPVSFFNGGVDAKSILKLHYAEAERLQGYTTQALAENILKERLVKDGKTGLTENGKVIAALRFLYEDPQQLAAFGDDATYVVTGLKKMAAMRPKEYARLLMAAGADLGNATLDSLVKDISLLEMLDTRTLPALWKSVANWEHVRKNLGPAGHIVEGSIVVAKANALEPYGRLHPEARWIKKAYENTAQVATKAGQVFQGLARPTADIPPAGHFNKIRSVSTELNRLHEKGDDIAAVGFYKVITLGKKMAVDTFISVVAGGSETGIRARLGQLLKSATHNRIP